jgi:HlyD family secretion protein
LEAQVKLAEAIIRQSDADLGTANTNLEFCDIKSPVDGIVIDRKVDPGQVVAAQFQTPVMFVVAPDLEKLVYVNASVDEADIGLIRDAQRTKQPVTFTVDAYPKDTFQGQIAQVRLNSTTVSNVVTYTVIVEAPNGELKLLPGMTANLAFQIEKKANLLTVPNAALRFHPTVEQVRLRDRAIVDGSEAQELEDKVAEQKAAEQKAPEQKSVEKNVTEQKTPELNNHGSTSGFAKTSASRDTVTKGSATKDSTSKAIAIRPVPSKDTASKAAVTTPKLDDKKHPDAKDEAAQRGKKAYVWVIEGNELAAIEVVAGVSDKRRTEIISGDLTEGRELVTGIKLKTVKPQEAGGP